MIITEPAALMQVLQEARVLYLALRAEPAPYVVPVFFGVDGELLYLHGRRDGRKIELLRSDPRVGFSACAGVTMIPAASACAFTTAAASVVGTGRARIVEDEAERIRGLHAVMAHYGDGDQGGDESEGRSRYRPESLARTCVVAIHVEHLSGKRIGPTGQADPVA